MTTHIQPKLTCAVSVIIPMYNAEEYIGECLDSLLIQTFQDFEVIVIDDCSTDKSFAIVDGYAPQFNERLILIKRKKNSGGGGYAPRNTGLKFASGEYVFFLDATDFILGNALETLYNAAKKKDADVVYTGAYYDMQRPNDVYLYRDGESKKSLKDESYLRINAPDKNICTLLADINGRNGNFHTPWTLFVKRDFLIENEIIFPNIVTGSDFLWVINVYAHAQRFLRLLTPLYFYRNYNTQSAVQKEMSAEEQISRWVSDFVTWAEFLSRLEKRSDTLSANPAYCLEALKSYFENSLSSVRETREKLSEQEVYEILCKKFVKDGALDLTLPFLFSVINPDKKAPAESAQSVKDFEPYLTARIDLKFTPQAGNGDLQILNFSDEKAVVTKPEWMQKNGVGYMITSFNGELEFIAGSTADGRLRISLKGLDVRDPENRSKRIPYWIDCTNLIINGKRILDKRTPVWHDKPYFHDVSIKANEKVTVQAEWLPHQSDI